VRLPPDFILVFSACFVLAACAELPAVPSQGGPAWYEVSGPHFRVYSDLPRDEAVARLHDLEHLFTAYLSLGWQTRGEWPPIRRNVVLMRDTSDVQVYAPAAGGYYLSNALAEPWAVMPNREFGRGLSALKHELMHHIAYTAIPHQPPWFSEGIRR
jgi:hypothetical protein